MKNLIYVVTLASSFGFIACGVQEEYESTPEVHTAANENNKKNEAPTQDTAANPEAKDQQQAQKAEPKKAAKEKQKRLALALTDDKGERYGCLLNKADIEKYHTRSEGDQHFYSVDGHFELFFKSCKGAEAYLQENRDKTLEIKTIEKSGLSLAQEGNAGTGSFIDKIWCTILPISQGCGFGSGAAGTKTGVQWGSGLAAFGNGTSTNNFIDKIWCGIPFLKEIDKNCTSSWGATSGTSVSDGRTCIDDPELSGKPNYSWAEVLSRVFGIDVLKCDCGGVFKPIAAIKDEEQARRCLRHVGLDHIPPARAQPRGSVQIVDFDQTSGDFVEEPVWG